MWGWARIRRFLELAENVKRAVGFGGKIRWDTSKPDGTPTEAFGCDED